MKCPACPCDVVPPQALRCPGCGADLTPLRRLQELAALHYNEALRLAERGAVESALVQAASAAALDARAAAPRVLLGKLLWKCDRRREALRQFKEALGLDPQHDDAKRLAEEAEKALAEAVPAPRAVPAAPAVQAAPAAGLWIGVGAAALLALAALLTRGGGVDNERVERLEAGVAAQGSETRKLEADLASNRERLERSDRDWKGLVQSLAKAEAVSTLDRKLDAFDKRLASLGALRGDLDALRETLGKVDERLAGLQELAERQARQVVAAETGLKRQDERVAGVARRVEALEARPAQPAPAASESGRLEGRVEELNRALEVERVDRARLLREMFAVLQPPEARDLAVRLARVRESLETLRANVGSLKDREAVAEMERTVASAEAEYARRFGDLERLARKLAAASNPRD